MPQLTEEDIKAAYAMQPFPLYEPDSSPFQDDNNRPGSAVGATAGISITFNNNPSVVYGVRTVNVWRRPEDVNDDVLWLDYLKALRESGYDQAQTIEFDLAQQNIVARQAHLETIVGANGVNWHPFPTPYLLRGGNNLQVRFRRLTTPPLVSEGTQRPTATVFVTMVLGTLMADSFPGSYAPSTQAYPRG